MNDSLASKVALARDAADRAVAGCDAARDDAIREAGLVDAAGDDVARRDVAALAAGDAALRCDTASSAALEAAACCEAVAEEATANNLANLHGDATFAAQQARAAAARCDLDGAVVAASRAANAIADGCVVACGDAAVLSVAAREAAARCVLTREDARTAALVVQQDALRSAYASQCPVIPYFLVAAGLYTDVAHRHAARRSAVAHTRARGGAWQAALAARKASVRCATASRRAAWAALIARNIASRCAGAGGDAATAAAAATREAADRCVTVTGAALDIDSTVPLADAVVPRAVSLADAAAVEAREAAASCDAAVADLLGDADANNMRGWLMMVATLFVGIAFQAVLQRPPTISFQNNSPKVVSGAASPAPAPATTADRYNAALLRYISRSGTWSTLIALIMFISLGMLVVLMAMNRAWSTRTLFIVRATLIFIGLTIGLSFIMALTEVAIVQCFYTTGILIIMIAGLFCVNKEF